MSAHIEWIGALDARVSLVRADDADADKYEVEEGQNALAISYDEVIVIVGTTAELRLFSESVRRAVEAAELANAG